MHPQNVADFFYCPPKTEQISYAAHCNPVYRLPSIVNMHFTVYVTWMHHSETYVYGVICTNTNQKHPLTAF